MLEQEDKSERSHLYRRLVISLAIAATVGPVLRNIGIGLEQMGILSDGHPSIAGLIFLLGGLWMRILCSVAVIVGVLAVAHGLKHKDNTLRVAIRIWTAVNLVHATAFN